MPANKRTYRKCCQVSIVWIDSFEAFWKSPSAHFRVFSGNLRIRPKSILWNMFKDVLKISKNVFLEYFVAFSILHSVPGSANYNTRHILWVNTACWVWSSMPANKRTWLKCCQVSIAWKGIFESMWRSRSEHFRGSPGNLRNQGCFESW